MKTTATRLTILLVTCTLIALGVSSAIAEDTPPSNIESYLLPDGLVDTDALRASGYQGGLNFTGYRLAPMANGSQKSSSDLKTAGDENWFGDFPSPFINYSRGACVWNGNLVVISYYDVFMWTDGTWQSLGANSNGGIRDLVIYNNDLIISGSFTIVGGQVANRIARFDGSQWRAIGNGMDNDVGAVGTFGTQLIAGGRFLVAGSGYANCLASWDGSNWSPLGDGLSIDDSSVSDLIEYDDQLIIGGYFRSAGTTIVNYIAAWDGSSFSSLQNGTDYEVESLAIYNGSLIAAGGFSTAGTIEANGVAMWDGTSWTDMGIGPNSYMYDTKVATINGSLYLELPDDMNNSSSIMRWENETWVTAFEIFESNTTFMVEFNGLFTYGIYFSNDNGPTVFSYDGSDWIPYYGNGLTGKVRASAVYDGSLIVAGDFWQAGNVQAQGIAHWDGTDWHSLGSGMPEGTETRINSMTVHDDKLIVGGWFESIGGVTAINVASWDGTTWAPIGDGLGVSGYYSGEVNTLLSHEDYLIAGGNFNVSGSTSVNRLAMWDGVQWFDVQAGSYATVHDIVAFGTGIAICGNDIAGMGSVVLLDETGYHPLGGGPNETIVSLAESDGVLVAASSSLRDGIFYWDGSSWHLLNPNDDENYNMSDIYDMTFYQDRLIVAGTFQSINGISAQRIAAWDGFNWSNLGSGAGMSWNEEVRSLTVSTWGLAVGGEFITAGNKPMAMLAFWSDIDCNNNGITDGIEIASSPELDLDNNGIIDSCQNSTPVLPGNLFANQILLLGTYPNPFNPSTTISFTLPASDTASLHIYDISGHLVCTLLNDHAAKAGYNEVIWNGRDATGRQVSSGVYFYQLEVGGFTDTKKMVLIK